MKKSILTIIINLKFNIINFYKLILSKDIILFNLNLEIIIYKKLLIEINYYNGGTHSSQGKSPLGDLGVFIHTHSPSPSPLVLVCSRA